MGPPTVLDQDDAEGDPILEQAIGTLPELPLSEPEIQAMSMSLGGPIKTKRFAGEVHGSLVESIKRTTQSNEATYSFVNAFLHVPELNERLLPGARFFLDVEGKELASVFIPTGRVISMGLEVDGHMVEKFRVPANGHEFFVTTDSDDDRPFYAPLDALHLSSLYSPRRFHPVKRRWRAHRGVDFRAPKGTPIMAVADGVIAKIGRGRGTGRFIAIQHDHGLETQYQHLSRFVPGLRAGDSIRAGTVIGQVGCTGWCRGSHLHFAVKLLGEWENPLHYLKPYPWSAQDRVLSLRASPPEVRLWMARRPASVNPPMTKPLRATAQPMPFDFLLERAQFN